tara:strand:- start:189 stop:671 length:483 start_codon:yes stop_codon:yes gene_type:complete
MIGKIYEENTKSIPTMKEAYIKWLNEEDWTFFSTLTTRYELTQKSARRAAERFHSYLKEISDNQCKMFFVSEKFELKDGFHLHALINLPEKFHEFIHFNKIISSWQLAAGTFHQKMDENGFYQDQKPSRIDLQKYDKKKGAKGYCAKYIFKKSCDYDILT